LHPWIYVFISLLIFLFSVLCWVFLFVFVLCLVCSMFSLSLHCPFLKFVPSAFIYVYYTILQEFSAAYNKITLHVINGPSMCVSHAFFDTVILQNVLDWTLHLFNWVKMTIYRANPTKLLLSSQVADRHAPLMRLSSVIKKAWPRVVFWRIPHSWHVKYPFVNFEKE
jgi:hypothetical protein